MVEGVNEAGSTLRVGYKHQSRKARSRNIIARDIIVMLL